MCYKYKKLKFHLFTAVLTVSYGSDLVGYSLTSVVRTLQLMSYDVLRTGDTTYSRWMLQIYDRSYAQVALACTQHYGGPLVPPHIFFIFLSTTF